MESILGFITFFAIFPGIICTFLYKRGKVKTELKKLEEQRKILELEIVKQNNQIKLLEEENKKIDKIIND
jgi:hypothetical protein